MDKIADFICKKKVGILIISGILFLMSIIGYILTSVNYDILVYLPKDIETVVGQNVLTDEFNMGAYTVVVTEGLNSKEINNLKNSYLEVDGVNKVLSAYDLMGNGIPVDILPSEIVSRFHKKNTDILFVTFNESTSADKTLNAINKMRKISKDKAKISGMSSMVVDTMNLSNREIIIYIAIAVILCLVVLELFLDSWLVPVILLLNIGSSIIYNLGSNIIFGEISYITKALVAVLQLGVTTDFSIFLYHAYESSKESSKSSIDAMKDAIVKTFKSIAGSSTTTIVGFLALCAMQLTLGKDLGLVMAKGVLIGVICVLTLFPSMILISENLINKTHHKSLSINFNWLNKKVIKHHKLIFAIFVVLIIPFYLANSKVDVYYKIDKSLPETLESIVANKELSDKFNIVSPEILLIPSYIKTSDEEKLLDEISNIDGIDFVLSTNKLNNLGLTIDMLPKELSDVLESKNYRMVFVNSLYEVASDELNNQVTLVNNVISKYDKNIILAGEGALMKDLVSISDRDFKNVNTYSIVLVLIVMFITLKSISLPILLVLTIEFAIFMNMGISYFGGTVLPFVAPIVLGTIQLGATIDYAILLTTNYLKNRKTMNKEDAMLTSTNYCGSSILVSALCFFAATFGVGVYSELEMVGSLCTLISRGAIISMFVVILILPSILLLFDKVIMATTLVGKESKKMKKTNMKQKAKKALVASLALLISLNPISVLAYTKEETVYSKLDANGNSINIIVNEYLKNDKSVDTLEDYSDLKDIVNLSGNETFTQNKNKITWSSSGNNIMYRGTTEKQLPIKESITYKLDGKSIDIDDLIGKSGKVEITIKYSNSSSKNVKINKKKVKLYTPFVVTTAITIDGTNNKNLSVKNGKVVDNGSTYVIAGLSAPGLYESLKLSSLKGLDKVVISYETTKFELSSIYTVITPKLIDNNDLEVFNQMDDVYKNVDNLQKNINLIESSAKTISKNIKVVSDSTGLVYDSLNLVLKNVKKLKDGTNTLDGGLKELSKSLKVATSDLNSKESLKKIRDMETLLKVNQNTIKDIKSKMSTLKNQYKAQDDVYDLKNKSLDTVYAMSKDLYTLKYTYENFYEQNLNLVELLSKDKEAIDGSIKSLKEISSSINIMNDAVKKLSNGSSEINGGLKQLEKGIDTLTSKVKELSDGTKKLSKGAKTFTKGVTKFNEKGINELTNYKNKAKNITNKLNKLVKLSNDYKTFTMANSNKNNSTKFIYVVDSIKVKSEKKEQTTKTKKTSFIDRVKNLFK